MQDPDLAILCLDPDLAGSEFEKKIRFWPDPDPVSLEKLFFPPSAFFCLIKLDYCVFNICNIYIIGQVKKFQI